MALERNATRARAPMAADGQARPGLGLHTVAVVLAVLGGAFGLAGAFVQEVLHAGGGLLLLAVVAAPVIEEVVKPGGVYLYLIRWPGATLGPLHVALLCALAGVTFGLLESTVYVQLYVSDPSSEYVTVRYTVPVAMHAMASFVAGLGLDRGLIDWAAGRGALPRRTRVSFPAAMLIHSAYNTAVIVMSFTGPLDFE